METRRDVFQALADPTRREIINLISRQPMNLNAIAENFDISRPAISNHIKILNECGIITIEQIGRERFCKIQASSLIPAFLWIDHHKQLWEDKLDSFENYINELKQKTKKDE